MANYRADWLAADQITDHPLNWRQHPEFQKQVVRASYDKVGDAGSLLVNERKPEFGWEPGDCGFVLLDGHLCHEIRSSEKLPCNIGNWTPDQEAFILATHDPMTALAQVEGEKLKAVLAKFAPQETDPQIKTLIADLQRQAQEAVKGNGRNSETANVGQLIDRAAELQAKWHTAIGDLWQVGRHKILCGDAGDIASWKKLLGNAEASLIFTSPPYDNNEKYEKQRSRQDYKLLLNGCCKAWSQIIRSGGIAVVNIGNKVGLWNTGLWGNALSDNGFSFVRRIVWKKPDGVGYPSQSIMRKYGWGLQYTPRMVTEDLLVFAAEMPDGVSDEADDLLVFSNGQRREPERARKLDREMAWKFYTDVWEIKPVQSDKKQGHPAAFPTQLPLNAISFYSLEDEIVADPFGGSGTTLVACEQTKRIGVATELDPKYLAVSLERLSLLGLGCKRL